MLRARFSRMNPFCSSEALLGVADQPPKPSLGSSRRLQLREFVPDLLDKP
jgi:hypothetical protein